MTESDGRGGKLETTTVYKSSILRTLLLAAGAGFFVLVGCVLMLTTEASSMVVGAMAFAFFGSCWVLLVLQLPRRKPELVITDRGFTHRRLGSVDWADVDRVQVSSIGGQPFVDVALRDPAAFLARSSLLIRVLGRLNQAFGFSPAVFSTQTMPASPDEVVAAMRHHRG
ncbi:STM3941 family protein [Nocardia sp. NPDC005746]|uniref:STM3941 family protein n=1 Tax=unclassified Nocardia TaxID=2637762 RepID=UPI0033D510A4